MRRGLLVVAGLLTAASVVIPASPASAVRSTTGVVLGPAVRLVDTDSSSSSIVSGVESVNPASVGALVNVGLIDPTDETWLYFHTCGSTPDRTTPAANFARAGETQFNLVPIRSGDTCMTLYGDGRLILDQIGAEGQPGGLAYVAHQVAVELDVAPIPGGIAHVSAGDPLVPAGAEAVAVWVSIRATEKAPAVWRAVGCDGAPLSNQVVIAPAGGLAANLMVLPLDVNGEICFTDNALTPAEVRLNRFGYLAPGVQPTAEGLPYSGFELGDMPGFTALSPSRLFDTRDAGTPLAAGAEYRFAFTNLPDDATAVALNITATQTGGPGFASAYPCDSDRPEVSNVNFTGANQTVPNFALVSVGAQHDVCFYASTQTHLLVDLSGYFGWDLGDGFTPTPPDRLFDTRQSGAPIPAATPYVFTVPGSGHSAVVMNVTVTAPAGNGFVTVYPCDTGRPEASNLNFSAGQTRPNLVTVRVPADGRVCFYSNVATHLLADLSGYYDPSSSIGFIDETPWRVFDTREPAGSPPDEAGAVYSIDVEDSDIEAVAWNVTVTQPSGPGFVSMFPCVDPPPTTSILNYAAFETVANFAIVQPNADGEVCSLTLASAHMIADEAGIFTGPLPIEVYYEGAPDDG